jgi:phosphatidylglycerophosphatase A
MSAKRIKITSEKIKDPAIWFTSFFLSGFFPKAPGTFASLLCFFCFIPLISLKIPPFFLSILFVVMAFPSMLIVDYTEKKYHQKDPSWIVIDEVLGMLLAFIVCSPTTYTELLLLFVLFRLFDILKPGPVGWIDRNIHNGFGNVCDDLLSGLFAGLITFFLNKLFLFQV